MTLEQLKYFNILSEEKSINKAAKRLFISQQCLSRSLNALEKELNCQLINRSYLGITLTSEGLEFLNFSRNVLRLYETMYQKVSSHTVNKNISGNLRLGVNSLIADNLMPELLPEYYHLNSELSIKILAETNYEIVNLLEKNKIDLGIIMYFFNAHGETYPILPKNFKRALLCDCNTIFWSGNKMVPPTQKFLSLQEVSNYPMAISKNTDMDFFKKTVFSNINITLPTIPLADNMNMISKIVESNIAICVDMLIGDKSSLFHHYFDNLQVHRLTVSSNNDYKLTLCYIFKYDNDLIQSFTSFLKRKLAP